MASSDQHNWNDPCPVNADHGRMRDLKGNDSHYFCPHSDHSRRLTHPFNGIFRIISNGYAWMTKDDEPAPGTHAPTPPEPKPGPKVVIRRNRKKVR